MVPKRPCIYSCFRLVGHHQQGVAQTAYGTTRFYSVGAYDSILTRMVVSLEGDVPGREMKGQGAKRPLCSGCLPGSEKRRPTLLGGGGRGEGEGE